MPHSVLRSVLVFMILVLVATSPLTAATATLDLESLSAILKAAEAAQGKKIPKALTASKRSGGTLDKGDYRPNDHLKAFPRLSLATGTVLDFVYDLQDLGGHPVVYSRKADATPFSDLAGFKKEHPRKYFLGSDARFDPAYLGDLLTDGSPDGFLHLGLLVLSAEQFYLFWHATYFRFWPVTDQATLDDVASSLPENLRERARAADFTPRVIMGPSEVVVDYLVFNSWEGLKRIAWTVTRAAPHRFLRVVHTIVLPYKSSVRF